MEARDFSRGRFTRTEMVYNNYGLSKIGRISVARKHLWANLERKEKRYVKGGLVMYPTDLCWETGEFTDDCCCDFCEHREECSGYDKNDDDDDWYATVTNKTVTSAHHDIVTTIIQKTIAVLISTRRWGRCSEPTTIHPSRTSSSSQRILAT